MSRIITIFVATADEQQWEATDLYCPQCGCLQVFVCISGTIIDHEQGSPHICVACDFMFFMEPVAVKLSKWSDMSAAAIYKREILKSDVVMHATC